MTHDDVPTWPEIKASINHTGTGEVLLNGISYPITEATADAGRDAVRRFVLNEAAIKLNRPVRLHTADDTGEWDLIVHPDGTIDDVTPASKQRRTRRTTEAQPVAPEHPTLRQENPVPPPPTQTTGPVIWGQQTAQPPAPLTQAIAPPPPVPAATDEVNPTVEPATAAVLAPVRAVEVPVPPAPPAPPFPPAPPADDTRAFEPDVPERLDPTAGVRVAPAPASSETEPRSRGVESFLVRDQVTYPAEIGLRGTLNKLGLKLDPTDEEMGLRRAVRIISQHWAGVRNVAVVNAKGSASKTPTTIGLSAAFAIHGGGGVTAVDNNPTRGTLGWRTEQGPHEASVTDLIPHIDELLRAEASGSQMSAYLHHQTEDRFDVLRSKPKRQGPPFTADEFDQVVRVLSKYSRILVFDSGNDETADVWKHMIARTDQLVVPTLARAEWAEVARLLLEELSEQGEHGAQLVANAVVIVSQADERKGTKAANEMAAGFHGLVRATAVIPYDPHMVEGHMRWNGMARTTKDAWIKAAALVAQTF